MVKLQNKLDYDLCIKNEKLGSGIDEFLNQNVRDWERAIDPQSQEASGKSQLVLTRQRIFFKEEVEISSKVEKDWASVNMLQSFFMQSGSDFWTI